MTFAAPKVMDLPRAWDTTLSPLWCPWAVLPPVSCWSHCPILSPWGHVHIQPALVPGALPLQEPESVLISKASVTTESCEDDWALVKHLSSCWFPTDIFHWSKASLNILYYHPGPGSLPRLSCCEHNCFLPRLLDERDMQNPQRNDCWSCLKLRPPYFSVPASWKNHAIWGFCFMKEGKESSRHCAGHQKHDW